MLSAWLLYNFNPRSLVGNDRGLATKMTTIWDFNPRSLVGNDRKDAERIFECSDFNPRSLVGNDGVGYFTPMFTVISIHVPSWGTTGDHRHNGILSQFQSTFPRGERQHSLYFLCELSYISIHVPSWGTTISSISSTSLPLFQSTFPRGERRHFSTFNSLVIISIHVPSWGTTANFHKYSLFFYAINIIFLLFIIPSLFSLVLFMLLF